MKKLPIVALIGQTNAGKSSLLNRFAHKNIAIVAREEGTTRDNVMTRIDNRFLLIDTAGLKDPDDDFETGIQNQITDAIESADLILLTLDSSKYTDDKDKQIAKNALKSKKTVLLLLNKSDLGESLPDEEFLRLGIKPSETFRVSATTGFGIKALKSAIFSELSAAGVLGNRQLSLEKLSAGQQPEGKAASAHNDESKERRVSQEKVVWSPKTSESLEIEGFFELFYPL